MAYGAEHFSLVVHGNVTALVSSLKEVGSAFTALDKKGQGWARSLQRDMARARSAVNYQNRAWKSYSQTMSQATTSVKQQNAAVAALNKSWASGQRTVASLDKQIEAYTADIDKSTKTGQIWAKQFEYGSKRMAQALNAQRTALDFLIKKQLDQQRAQAAYNALMAKGTATAAQQDQALKRVEITTARLTNAQGAYNARMSEFQRTVAGTGTMVDNYSRSVALAQTRMQRWGGVGNKVLSGMNKAANVLIGYLTSIVFLLQRATTTFLDWGMSIEKMRGISDMNAPQASTFLGVGELLGIEPNVMITSYRYAMKNTATALSNFEKAERRIKLAQKSEDLRRLQMDYNIEKSLKSAESTFIKKKISMSIAQEEEYWKIKELGLKRQQAAVKMGLRLSQYDLLEKQTLTGGVFKTYEAYLKDKTSKDQRLQRLAESKRAYLETANLAEIMRTFQFDKSMAKLAQQAAKGAVTWQEAQRKLEQSKADAKFKQDMFDSFSQLAAEQRQYNYAPDAMMLIKLGILQRGQTKNLPKPKEITNQLIELMPQLEAGERMKVMQKFFGRGAGQAIRYFMQTAEQRRFLEEQAKAAGIVFSDKDMGRWRKIQLQVNLLKANWKGVQIAATKALVPILSAALPWLRKTFEWLRKNYGMVKLIGGAVLALVAAAKTFVTLKAAWGFATAVGSAAKGIATMGPSVAKALPAVGRLGTSLAGTATSASALFGPTGLLVAGIATAATVGLTLLYRKWEPFRKLVDSTWSAVKGIFGAGDKEKTIAIKYEVQNAPIQDYESLKKNPVIAGAMREVQMRWNVTYDSDTKRFMNLLEKVMRQKGEILITVEDTKDAKSFLDAYNKMLEYQRNQRLWAAREQNRINILRGLSGEPETAIGRLKRGAAAEAVGLVDMVGTGQYRTIKTPKYGGEGQIVGYEKRKVEILKPGMVKLSSEKQNELIGYIMAYAGGDYASIPNEWLPVIDDMWTVMRNNKNWPQVFSAWFGEDIIAGAMGTGWKPKDQAKFERQYKNWTPQRRTIERMKGTTVAGTQEVPGTEMDKAAKDLVSGLVGGLTDSEAARDLRRGGVFVAQTLIDALKSKEGLDEHSASKKGIEIGLDLVAGVAEGVMQGTEAVSAVVSFTQNLLDAGKSFETKLPQSMATGWAKVIAIFRTSTQVIIGYMTDMVNAINIAFEQLGIAPLASPAVGRSASGHGFTEGAGFYGGTGDGSSFDFIKDLEKSLGLKYPEMPQMGGVFGDVGKELSKRIKAAVRGLLTAYGFGGGEIEDSQLLDTLTGATPLLRGALSTILGRFSDLKVTAVKEGHSKYVKGTDRISEHFFGRAADLWTPNPFGPKLDAVYDWLKSSILAGNPLRIRQLIHDHEYFTEGKGFSRYGSSDHRDHIHMSVMDLKVPDTLGKMMKQGQMFGQIMKAFINYGSIARNLDPKAALAVASVEGGFMGAVGDSGSSFGPFQLHKGGALPKWVASKGSTFAKKWAQAPEGVDYALNAIAKVAAGLRKLASITAIVTKFERPRDPKGEIAKAWDLYPKMAKGGYVEEPTVALIGEAGPEFVFNKEQMHGLSKLFGSVPRKIAIDDSKLSGSMSRALKSALVEVFSRYGTLKPSQWHQSGVDLVGSPEEMQGAFEMLSSRANTYGLKALAHSGKVWTSRRPFVHGVLSDSAARHADHVHIDFADIGEGKERLAAGPRKGMGYLYADGGGYTSTTTSSSTSRHRAYEKYVADTRKKRDEMAAAAAARYGAGVPGAPVMPVIPPWIAGIALMEYQKPHYDPNYQIKSVLDPDYGYRDAIQTIFQQKREAKADEKKLKSLEADIEKYYKSGDVSKKEYERYWDARRSFTNYYAMAQQQANQLASQRAWLKASRGAQKDEAIFSAISSSIAAKKAAGSASNIAYREAYTQARLGDVPRGERFSPHAGVIIPSGGSGLAGAAASPALNVLDYLRQQWNVHVTSPIVHGATTTLNQQLASARYGVPAGQQPKWGPLGAQTPDFVYNTSMVGKAGYTPEEMQNAATILIKNLGGDPEANPYALLALQMMMDAPEMLAEGSLAGMAIPGMQGAYLQSIISGFDKARPSMWRVPLSIAVGDLENIDVVARGGKSFVRPWQVGKARTIAQTYDQMVKAILASGEDAPRTLAMGGRFDADSIAQALSPANFETTKYGAEVININLASRTRGGPFSRSTWKAGFRKYSDTTERAGVAEILAHEWGHYLQQKGLLQSYGMTLGQFNAMTKGAYVGQQEGLAWLMAELALGEGIKGPTEGLTYSGIMAHYMDQSGQFAAAEALSYAQRNRQFGAGVLPSFSTSVGGFDLSLGHTSTGQLTNPFLKSTVGKLLASGEISPDKLMGRELMTQVEFGRVVPHLAASDDAYNQYRVGFGIMRSQTEGLHASTFIPTEAMASDYHNDVLSRMLRIVHMTPERYFQETLGDTVDGITNDWKPISLLRNMATSEADADMFGYATRHILQGDPILKPELYLEAFSSGSPMPVGYRPRMSLGGQDVLAAAALGVNDVPVQTILSHGAYSQDWGKVPAWLDKRFPSEALTQAASGLYIPGHLGTPYPVGATPPGATVPGIPGFIVPDAQGGHLVENAIGYGIGVLPAPPLEALLKGAPAPDYGTGAEAFFRYFAEMGTAENRAYPYEFTTHYEESFPVRMQAIERVIHDVSAVMQGRPDPNEVYLGLFQAISEESQGRLAMRQLQDLVDLTQTRMRWYAQPFGPYSDRMSFPKLSAWYGLQRGYPEIGNWSHFVYPRPGDEPELPVEELLARLGAYPHGDARREEVYEDMYSYIRAAWLGNPGQRDYDAAEGFLYDYTGGPGVGGESWGGSSEGGSSWATQVDKKVMEWLTGFSGSGSAGYRFDESIPRLSPDMPRLAIERMIRDTSVMAAGGAHEVYIPKLWTPREARGAGSGRATLASLRSLTDQTGAPIFLKASPFELEGKLTPEEIEALLPGVRNFYAHGGFGPVRGHEDWFRYPAYKGATPPIVEAQGVWFRELQKKLTADYLKGVWGQEPMRFGAGHPVITESFATQVERGDIWKGLFGGGEIPGPHRAGPPLTHRPMTWEEFNARNPQSYMDEQEYQNYVEAWLDAVRTGTKLRSDQLATGDARYIPATIRDSLAYDYHNPYAEVGPSSVRQVNLPPGQYAEIERWLRTNLEASVGSRAFSPDIMLASWRHGDVIGTSEGSKVSVMNIARRLKTRQPMTPPHIGFDFAGGMSPGLMVVDQNGRHRAFTSDLMGLDEIPMWFYLRGGDNWNDVPNDYAHLGRWGLRNKISQRFYRPEGLGPEWGRPGGAEYMGYSYGRARGVMEQLAELTHLQSAVAKDSIYGYDVMPGARVASIGPAVWRTMGYDPEQAVKWGQKLGYDVVTTPESHSGFESMVADAYVINPSSVKRSAEQLFKARESIPWVDETENVLKPSFATQAERYSYTPKLIEAGADLPEYWYHGSKLGPVGKFARRSPQKVAIGHEGAGAYFASDPRWGLQYAQGMRGHTVLPYLMEALVDPSARFINMSQPIGDTAYANVIADAYEEAWRSYLPRYRRRMGEIYKQQPLMGGGKKQTWLKAAGGKYGSLQERVLEQIQFWRETATGTGRGGMFGADPNASLIQLLRGEFGAEPGPVGLASPEAMSLLGFHGMSGSGLVPGQLLVTDPRVLDVVRRIPVAGVGEADLPAILGENFTRIMQQASEYSAVPSGIAGYAPKPVYASRVRNRGRDYLAHGSKAFKGANKAQVDEGLAWYQREAKFITDYARKKNVSPSDALRAVAILSAGSRWETNKTDIVKYIDAFAAGAGRPKASGHFADRAWEALQGKQMGDLFKDPQKLEPFYRALMGDPNAIPIDRWMARVLRGPAGRRLKTATPTSKQYEEMQVAVRNLAAHFGYSPRDMQSILWAVARGDMADVPAYASKVWAPSAAQGMNPRDIIAHGGRLAGYDVPEMLSELSGRNQAANMIRELFHSLTGKGVPGIADLAVHIEDMPNLDAYMASIITGMERELSYPGPVKLSTMEILPGDPFGAHGRHQSHSGRLQLFPESHVGEGLPMEGRVGKAVNWEMGALMTGDYTGATLFSTLPADLMLPGNVGYPFASDYESLMITVMHELAHARMAGMSRNDQRGIFNLLNDYLDDIQAGVPTHVGIPSAYSTANPEEWFAENLTAYRLGAPRVDPALKVMFEDYGWAPGRSYATRVARSGDDDIAEMLGISGYRIIDPMLGAPERNLRAHGRIPLPEDIARMTSPRELQKAFLDMTRNITGRSRRLTIPQVQARFVTNEQILATYEAFMNELMYGGKSKFDWASLHGAYEIGVGRGTPMGDYNPGTHEIRLFPMVMQDVLNKGPKYKETYGFSQEMYEAMDDVWSPGARRDMQKRGDLFYYMFESGQTHLWENVGLRPGTTVPEAIRSTVSHEMGHARYFALPYEQQQAIMARYAEAYEGKKTVFPSIYSALNAQEWLAESMAAIRGTTGEQVDPFIWKLAEESGWLDSRSSVSWASRASRPYQLQPFGPHGIETRPYPGAYGSASSYYHSPEHHSVAELLTALEHSTGALRGKIHKGLGGKWSAIHNLFGKALGGRRGQRGAIDPVLVGLGLTGAFMAGTAGLGVYAYKNKIGAFEPEVRAPEPGIQIGESYPEQFANNYRTAPFTPFTSFTEVRDWAKSWGIRPGRRNDSPMTLGEWNTLAYQMSKLPPGMRGMVPGGIDLYRGTVPGISTSAGIYYHDNGGTIGLGIAEQLSELNPNWSKFAGKGQVGGNAWSTSWPTPWAYDTEMLNSGRVWNTPLHEFGHGLDFFGNEKGISSTGAWGSLYGKYGKMFGEYPSSKPSEFFAEAFMMYFNSAKTRATMPKDLRLFMESVAGVNSWNPGPHASRYGAYAGGGVITQPTVALMGENGPEMVFNADQMRALRDLFGRDERGRSGGAEERWDKVTYTLTEATNLIIENIRWAANRVAGSVNRNTEEVVSAILMPPAQKKSKKKDDDVLTFSKVDDNVLTFRKVAKGMKVSRPTLLLAGEAGPEWVFNQPQMRVIERAIEKGSQNESQKREYHVHVNLSLNGVVADNEKAVDRLAEKVGRKIGSEVEAQLRSMP